MQNPFLPGQIKVHRKVVSPDDVARFEAGLVHQVCSTFALAREMEWASRLFVLEMKEEGEEGIGTMLHIEHLSPALPGETLEITAEFGELKGNNLICPITVKVNDRLVARGQTGQKIIRKDKMAALLASLEKPNGEQ